jgi:hypothetical protein
MGAYAEPHPYSRGDGISLSSTRSAPKPDQPIRSKTDADRAKLLKQQMHGRPMSEFDSVPQSAVTLDLPTIPRKKFNPSKLSTEQYRRCSEPWALSGQEDDNEEQTEARKEPEPKFESEPGDTSTSQVDGEGNGNFDLVDNLLMQWTNLSKDEYMALQEAVALE